MIELDCIIPWCTIVATQKAHKPIRLEMRGKVELFKNFLFGELQASTLVSFKMCLISLVLWTWAYSIFIAVDSVSVFLGTESTFALRCQWTMRAPCIKLKCCQAHRRTKGHEKLEIQISCPNRLFLARKQLYSLEMFWVLRFFCRKFMRFFRKSGYFYMCFCWLLSQKTHKKERIVPSYLVLLISE